MKAIKKNCINLKVKSTSIMILLITALFLAALSGTKLIKEVAAVDYAEYTGTLDGAKYVFRIPDSWNGMLVVCCRGYSHTPIADVKSSLPFSQMAPLLLEQGFAVAASDYGAGGYCVPEGVNSTYQLTEYIIENYNVSARVFLIGGSMGGNVALLLGEKHPELFSGVLDMFGVKDLKEQYETKVIWASLNDSELEAELTALTAPAPPFMFPSLESFRSFCNVSATDIASELGGTPEDEPEAYEAVSPLYNANISIPVITVHGTSDALVPYSQSVAYQEAVANAGRSSLYRLYNVTGGQHGSSDVEAEGPGRFDELVEWSNYLTGVYDWPMFRHDLQHSGYSGSKAPSTNQTLWTSTTSVIGGQNSPVVADKKVYVGSWDGNLYCFDAANGTQLWLYTPSNYIPGTCAVADGRVYYSTLDCNIYCNDATNGDLLWNYSASNLVGSLLGSSPAVSDGKVYVGSYDDNVYCLDAANGTKIWNYTTMGVVRSSPNVNDGGVYIGSDDDNVYCLDAATGIVIWNYTTGNDVRSSPAVVDGKVYVGSMDNNIYCLDALNGTKIWNYTAGDLVASSPAVADGKVYVGSNDDNVYCLDALNGTKIWNYTTEANVFSCPAVADGKVYIASMDNKLFCFDAITGDFIWSFTTLGNPTYPGFYSSPAVANGVLYIYATDEHLYAIGTEYLVPDGLSIEVVLLLSAAVAVVSLSFFHKRIKWKKQQ